MTLTKESSTPFELQCAGIAAGGKNPDSVFALIQSFIKEHDGSLRSSRAPIHILLDSSIIGIPGLEPIGSSTLILDLESVDLVRFCNHHQGPIRWFSKRDPRDLVGPMLDHYRGTYFLRRSGEIIYSGDHDLDIIPISKDVEVTSSLLAAICAAREAGISPQTISSVLKKSGRNATVHYAAVEKVREPHILTEGKI